MVSLLTYFTGPICLTRFLQDINCKGHLLLHLASMCLTLCSPYSFRFLSGYGSDPCFLTVP